jgi:hypothetical protein
MGTGVFRYRGTDRQAATYWRRRFLVLVLGLTVLALIAWVVSGALNSGLAVRPAAADHASHGGQGAGHAPHGPGRPGLAAVPAAAASSQAGPSGPATAAPGHSPAAPGTPAPAPVASPGLPAGGHGGQARTCGPGQVVLSLSSSQDSFGSREPAVFDLDVVSMSARTCTFNVGAKYLTLVIRAGRTRIWGSADCVEGRGSLVTDLQRGVPTVLPISWDRETSSPGCEIGSARVRAGSYAATVIDGADVSNTETFRLR